MTFINQPQTSLFQLIHTKAMYSISPPELLFDACKINDIATIEYAYHIDNKREGRKSINELVALKAIKIANNNNHPELAIEIIKHHPKFISSLIFGCETEIENKPGTKTNYRDIPQRCINWNKFDEMDYKMFDETT